MKNKKTKIFSLVVIILSIVVVLLSAYFIDGPEKIISTVKQANAYYLLLAAFLIFLFWFFGSLSLNALLKVLGARIRQVDAFKVTMTGAFFQRNYTVINWWTAYASLENERLRLSTRAFIICSNIITYNKQCSYSYFRIVLYLLFVPKSWKDMVYRSYDDTWRCFKCFSNLINSECNNISKKEQKDYS